MEDNEDDGDPGGQFGVSENILDKTETSTFLKRKGHHDHEVRLNPRFSDLFSSPASGAPIIVQLSSEPLTFRSMNLTEKKKFITGLIELIGQVRPGTKWTQRGDLYIFPTTNRQKELLLQQKCVSGYQISCSLCKTEQEVRGVVYNVPPNNTEEELLELLSNQGVFKVKRFTNIGPNNITNTLPMVSLYFNIPNLPREVIIAHEIFPVKKYIPRPSLCRKCWIFGHPEDLCPNIPVCRYCTSAHELNNLCKNQSAQHASNPTTQQEQQHVPSLPANNE